MANNLVDSDLNLQREQYIYASIIGRFCFWGK